MNKLICLIALIVGLGWGASSSWAAAPITHAYLTYRFFEHFPKYTPEQQQLFLAGTLFPDIRYLSGNRNQTHYQSMSLTEVLNEPSPFMAGVKFHSYVDIVRETFVIDQGIYYYLGNFPKDHIYTLVKLLEDEILYNKANWTPVLTAIKEVHPEQQMWGFTKENIELWHNMLRMVFMNSPANLLSLLTLSHKGILDVSPEETALWNQSFKSLANDTYIQNYVWKLTQLFERLFSTS